MRDNIQFVSILESPDYNSYINGRNIRLAINRCAICIMAEFGMANNRKIRLSELNSFIESI